MGLPFPLAGRSCQAGEVPRRRTTAGRSGDFSRLSIQKTSRSCSGIGSLSQPGGFVGSRTGRFRLRFACDRIEESGCLRKALRFRPGCLPVRLLLALKKCSTERATYSEPTESMLRCRLLCGVLQPVQVEKTSSSFWPSGDSILIRPRRSTSSAGKLKPCLRRSNRGDTGSKRPI